VQEEQIARACCTNIRPQGLATQPILFFWISLRYGARRVFGRYTRCYWDTVSRTFKTCATSLVQDGILNVERWETKVEGGGCWTSKEEQVYAIDMHCLHDICFHFQCDVSRQWTDTTLIDGPDDWVNVRCSCSHLRRWVVLGPTWGSTLFA